MENEQEDSQERQDDDYPAQGLTCFLSPVRVCGPDCMAYTTYPSESPHLSDQQKHCATIVGVERMGRYMGGLLKVIKDSKQDEARKAPPTSIPESRGQ